MNYDLKKYLWWQKNNNAMTKLIIISIIIMWCLFELNHIYRWSKI